MAHSIDVNNVLLLQQCEMFTETPSIGEKRQKIGQSFAAMHEPGFFATMIGDPAAELGKDNFFEWAGWSKNSNVDEFLFGNAQQGQQDFLTAPDGAELVNKQEP